MIQFYGKLYILFNKIFKGRTLVTSVLDSVNLIDTTESSL